MSEVTRSPQIALVGSGEFLPVMADVDRALLTGRRARVVHLPTAAVMDGAVTVQKWTSMAARHYEAMGAAAHSVLVEDRMHANDPIFAEQIADAGLIYLSGGNPGFLADTLRGTLVWEAIVAAINAGAAIAGCSAGAMALTLSAPDVRNRAASDGFGGLALIGHLVVIPHFDRMRAYRPGLAEEMVAKRPPGAIVIGVDEDTALVGHLDDESWVVMGRQGVHILGADGAPMRSAAAGERLMLPPGTATPQE